MEKHQVIELIQKLSLYQGISEQEVEECSGLLSEGVIDSLGLMELIAWLETSLKAKVSHSAITVRNFDSVGAILNLCNNLHP
jgi:acyl carrier protein